MEVKGVLKRLQFGGVTCGVWDVGSVVEGEWFCANVCNGDGKVVGFWTEKMARWSWKLVWTATLSVTETAAVGELLLLLEPVSLRRDSNDKRKWIPNAA
ncbi:hypothetical protein L195_g055370, partial [Trifolium pratense]